MGGSRRGATMKALISAVLLLAAGIANAQDNETCSYTCSITQKAQDGSDSSSWAILMDTGIDYFYLQSQNVFVVYNQFLHNIILVDGNSGTETIIDTDTGFGIIINLATNVAYIIDDSTQNFDMSTLADGSYQVIISIYQYSSQYIGKVTEENVDITADGYFTIDEALNHMIDTVDVSQWDIFKGREALASRIQTIVNEIHNLYDSKQYAVDSGPSIFMVVLTQIYKSDDPLLTNISQFAIFLIQTLNGKFDVSLMQEYYNLITSDQGIEYIRQQFTYLIEAIKGVGFTYGSLTEALDAYRQRTVVETYVSTITDSNNNSYLAYNSMQNGTWKFRVMYTNKGYVQVSASYVDQLMSIFDPNIDVVLVYTEGPNFGLVNWKTGNGLVINGANGIAVYAKSSNDEIVRNFEANLIADGIIAISKFVLATDNTQGNTFQADQLLKAIHDGNDDISDIIKDQELRDTIQNEFALLFENLKNIDYVDDCGANNLVAFMLGNTRSTFFQSGFVKLICNMYKFNIAGARFYKDIYAGILYSIEKHWDAPIFDNLNLLMTTIPNDNNPDDVLNFIEMYMQLTWKINPNSPNYYKDGTITN